MEHATKCEMMEIRKEGSGGQEKMIKERWRIREELKEVIKEKGKE